MGDNTQTEKSSDPPPKRGKKQAEQKGVFHLLQKGEKEESRMDETWGNERSQSATTIPGVVRSP